MSETALSAAHKVLACIRSYNTDAAINCILPPAEVLADVIETEYGPVVDALRDAKKVMDHFGDFLNGMDCVAEVEKETGVKNAWVDSVFAKVDAALEAKP